VTERPEPVKREYGYAPIGLTMAMGVSGLVICPDCGAMVLHTEIHDKFHDQLTQPRYPAA